MVRRKNRGIYEFWGTSWVLITVALRKYKNPPNQTVRKHPSSEAGGSALLRSLPAVELYSFYDCYLICTSSLNI